MTDQSGDFKIDLEGELLSPYTYLMKFRGKQIRHKIVRAFNHWLNVPQEKLDTITNTTYMIHVASLLLANLDIAPRLAKQYVALSSKVMPLEVILITEKLRVIDDIQDGSKIRRGVPTADCVYGIPLTINAGIHIFLLAFEKIFKMNLMAGEVLLKQALEVIQGQGCDIYWRENALCPTEEQYKRMAEQKTGRMFSLPVQIMQLFSENKTDYSNFALLLGCYFQIKDDYCNLMKQEALEEWLGKDKIEGCTDTLCEDITEGKFTFPVIHAMQSSEGEVVLNILRKRTRDVNLKKHCLSLLEKAGSLQYTRDALTEFDRKARAEVARLGGNPEMEAVLDELLDWL